MRHLICACLSAWAFFSHAHESAAGQAKGDRWAVIVVGLPGDKQHAVLFAETADAWEKWLTKTLDFSADHVLRLPAVVAENDGPSTKLTADVLRTTFAELSRRLTADDSLWVFTLGHGNYDGKHAWFHVAERDPSNEDFGRWLGTVHCREQVIWLTHSSSGWFVKPLSKPGRIVIAATAADDESNETEFPSALAETVGQPLEALDADGDGKVSVAELFAAVVREVHSRFESDKRLPTEHAQLDDDGDGRGSEELTPEKEANEAEPPAGQPAAAKPPTPKVDGSLARKTFVPFRRQFNRDPKGERASPAAEIECGEVPLWHIRG